MAGSGLFVIVLARSDGARENAPAVARRELIVEQAREDDLAADGFRSPHTLDPDFTPHPGSWAAQDRHEPMADVRGGSRTS